MVQFYALSVFANIFLGILLSSGTDEGKETVLTRIKGLLDEKGVKFILGLFSLIVGLFKILTPTAGDVPVIGDILPAVSGMALGGILLLDFYKASSDLHTATVEKVDNIILRNKRYLGMAGILAGLLHFFMPGVPIL